MVYNVVMKLTTKVNAKLNLNLQVLGEQDGYHMLDSVMVAVDIYDTVVVESCNNKTITINGTPNIPDIQNTAYKSAIAFCQQYDTNGCNITITKGIPMASGLGGSSADGSAVLVALATMYGIDTNTAEFVRLARSIGSDVPYMVRGGISRLTDSGSQLECVPVTNALNFVITCFANQPMSTAEVFSNWDKWVGTTKQGDGRLFDAIKNNQPIKPQWLVNDLQPIVTRMSNYAQEYMHITRQLGVHTCITGSGSAFFVMCDSRRQAEQLASVLQSYGFDSRACTQQSSCVEILQTA